MYVGKEQKYMIKKNVLKVSPVQKGQNLLKNIKVNAKRDLFALKVLANSFQLDVLKIIIVLKEQCFMNIWKMNY